MIEDPIVDEVHKTRERPLEQYGMDGLHLEFRAIEDEMKDRVVRLESRKPGVRSAIELSQEQPS